MDPRFEQRIKRTLELALEARAQGDHPFGALIELDGEIVLEDRNRVAGKKDPTQHAELRVLQRLAGWPAKHRARAILFTSTEPCAMCCGATYWAGIRHVVYGCPEAALGEMAGTDFLIPSREIFAASQQGVEVTGPVLEPEARAVHEGFWG